MSGIQYVPFEYSIRGQSQRLTLSTSWIDRQISEIYLVLSADPTNLTWKQIPSQDKRMTAYLEFETKGEI